ncbi:Phage-related minor tail protein [Nocardioides sp. YR527]|uniref:phage tail tape measure protein n=1 Tax=Nocardioides sp. YR527 TaxID=1881028 RepID=UPI00088C46BA|nr:phage tail tape measure protein [Nocardioides sp. YR527]SDL14309.1 Phage-related minor tail protein [Nocardioides sp. YR527]
MDIGTLAGYLDLDVSKFDTALESVQDKIGESTESWKGKMALGGAAAAALFGASLVSAMNLEPGQDKIAASLGLTEKQAEIAGKVAGDVYANGWGQSADDVNNAVESIMSSIKGMKGASASELQSVTEDAMAFSQAMEIDVTRAAQVAGNMIANGMAKDATEAFDLMTVASQKVPKALREDILDATDEYGQFFNTIGIKGPEAMGILAQGAEKGMYGIDKAGDAVKEFTIRSTDMSNGSISAYKAIGLNADDMANKILAGGDSASGAFNQIIDGILGIEDPAKRANTAIALFGTPLEDIGVKDIPKFLKGLKSGQTALGDYEGAAKKAGETLSDNASSNITAFTRKVQGAFVDVVGGTVLPIVNEFAAALNGKLGPAFTVLGDAISGSVKWLSEHKAVSIPLIGIIAALAAVTGVYAAVTAVQAAGGVLAFVKGLKLVRGAMLVATAVQWAYNLALTANPIGIIIVAIAALVAGLIWFFTKTEVGRKIFSAAMEGMKIAAQAVADFFTETLPEAASTAWRWITDKFNALVTFHAALPGRIGKAVSGLFNKAQDLSDKAKSYLIDKAVGFVTWYFSMPGRIARAAIGLFDKPRALARDARQYAIDRMVGLLDWLAGLPGRVSNRTSGTFNKVKSLARDAKDSAVGKMNDMLGWLGGLPGRVSRKVGGMFDAIPAAMRAAAQGVRNAWNENIGGKGLTIDLPDKLPGLPNSWSVSIPRLATGGRVGAYKPMTAIIGDANEPENVLRDSQLKAVVMAAIGMAGGRGGGGPMIGQLVTNGADADAIAEGLWHKLRSRG